MDDQRSAPQIGRPKVGPVKLRTKSQPPKVGQPKVGPQKLDDQRSSPKNRTTESRPQKWTTEGRSPKIGRSKVVPQKQDDRRSAPKMDDRRSAPKNGRSKVGPKNWTTKGRPLKMVVRTEGPVHQDRTAPMGQYNRTKLARRASKFRLFDFELRFRASISSFDFGAPLRVSILMPVWYWALSRGLLALRASLVLTYLTICTSPLGQFGPGVLVVLFLGDDLVKISFFSNSDSHTPSYRLFRLIGNPSNRKRTFGRPIFGGPPSVVHFQGPTFGRPIFGGRPSVI